MLLSPGAPSFQREGANMEGASESFFLSSPRKHLLHMEGIPDSGRS
jgi:hypothetical protein